MPIMAHLGAYKLFLGLSSVVMSARIHRPSIDGRGIAALWAKNI